MRPGVLHDVNVPSFVTYVPVLSAEGVSIVLQSVTTDTSTTPPPPWLDLTRCENFQISRGVLQGDVVSPLFFILTLEVILRRHDPIKTGQGVPLVEILIRLLGYADDVAVTEEGDMRVSLVLRTE